MYGFFSRAFGHPFISSRVEGDLLKHALSFSFVVLYREAKKNYEKTQQQYYKRVKEMQKQARPTCSISNGIAKQPYGTFCVRQTDQIDFKLNLRLLWTMHSKRKLNNNNKLNRFKLHLIAGKSCRHSAELQFLIKCD